jgi:hypothetical protein
LSARKLIECIESGRPNFSKDYFVEKAINEVVFVLEKIDKKWPPQDERKYQGSLRNDTIATNLQVLSYVQL